MKQPPITEKEMRSYAQEMGIDIHQVNYCEPAVGCPMGFIESSVQATPPELAETCHGYIVRNYP